MPFAASELTQIMGLGHYVGEVRQGPDAQLYEWVEGADGVGNPIGFWRGFKRLARRALPLTRFIPGYGTAIYAAGTAAQRAGLLGTDSTGKIGQGPDGQLYEWVEGVDGLGNPIGFWKKLRRAAGGLLRRALPVASKFIPGAGTLLPAAASLLPQASQLIPAASAVLPAAMSPLPPGGGPETASDVLPEESVGQLYEVVEGIGEDGRVRRSVRKVWLKIPAEIGPRRVRRRVRRPVSTAPTDRVVQPGAPMQRVVRAVRPGAPMRRVVRQPMARPISRFR
jgi:hypothetical protein